MPKKDDAKLPERTPDVGADAVCVELDEKLARATGRSRVCWLDAALAAHYDALGKIVRIYEGKLRKAGAPVQDRKAPPTPRGR